MPRELSHHDPMELMRELSIQLEDAGIPDAEREAELMVVHFSGIDRTALWRDRPAIDQEALQAIEDALSRRLTREPLQYIIGEVEFWSLTIAVGDGVLIPRPETELIVEEVLQRVDKGKTLRVLDLCTGSGCLALALARELPNAKVTGTDVSVDALSYAVRNAIVNGIENIHFLEGSLFAPIRDERFDLIVSNPPYIPTADIDMLQPEIAKHEPREALDGGSDGLAFYRMILDEAPAHLKPGGLVALELGMGQTADVAQIASKVGLEVLTVRKDLAGIERVLVAENISK